MTKLLLEVKDESQMPLLKAILASMNISVLEEEKVEEEEPFDYRAFYDKFQIDMSQFTFDREEANER